MSELSVFVQAMLPIAGSSGLELIRAGTRALVRLGAEVAVVTERVDGDGPVHLVAACSAEGSAEAELGTPADAADLEARCRALAGDRADASWHVMPAGATARLAVVVKGEMPAPLRAALEVLAERSSAELARMHAVAQTKALEHRLVLAERLASMGTLAAGIAHEINNPLAYVKGNVEHVLQELRGISGIAPDLLAALEEAREGADRVKRIVQYLRVFSRPHDNEPIPIDVERVIDSALAIAGNDIRHRARLEKVFRRPPPVAANEASFGQVILNLLENALHALPEGAPDENELRIETGVDEAARVFVVVADTGTGIPPDVIGRIFDPFFTTKPVGVGTGLGLSIAHSIVTSLGGDITVDSALGCGTTFRVTLPARSSS